MCVIDEQSERGTINHNLIAFTGFPFVFVEFERLAWIPLHHGTNGLSLRIVLFDGLVRMLRSSQANTGQDRRRVGALLGRLIPVLSGD